MEGFGINIPRQGGAYLDSPRLRHSNADELERALSSALHQIMHEDQELLTRSPRMSSRNAPAIPPPLSSSPSPSSYSSSTSPMPSPSGRRGSKIGVGFGVGDRFKSNQKSSSPGAIYTPRSSFDELSSSPSSRGGIPFSSTSDRFKHPPTSSTSQNLGPGAYGSSPSSPKSSSLMFSSSPRSSSSLSSSSLSSSPSFSSSASGRRVQSTFGKSERFKLQVDLNKPDPVKYNVPSTFDSPLSSRMAQSDISSSFGTGHRFSPQKPSNLGPGSYSLGPGAFDDYA